MHHEHLEMKMKLCQTMMQNHHQDQRLVILQNLKNYRFLVDYHYDSVIEQVMLKHQCQHQIHNQHHRL